MEVQIADWLSLIVRWLHIIFGAAWIGTSFYFNWLNNQVRPVECVAVARYALAARAGRAGSFDDAYTRIAIDRLQAYGDERIAECVAEAHSRDATFEGYVPGEFARSPRGKPLEIRPGIAPPAITRENE